MATTHLRVAQANISYGGHGTDNIINLDRTTNWLVSMQPDLVSLTEVIEGWKDQEKIVALMNLKTGIPWSSAYVPKYMGSVEGVMALSKWPIVTSTSFFMSYQMPIIETTINVNGKLISFFATHFQWPNTAAASAQRQVQAQQLVDFAMNFPEPRIIAGDFNAQINTPEMQIILHKYFGGWDKAVAAHTATSYPDNPPNLSTRTRRTRIDHVVYSRTANGVTVTDAMVPDQRAPNTASKVTVKIGTTDDKGVRPSDHNFMWVGFNLT